MNDTEDILKRHKPDDHLRVPDGYFDGFAQKMSAQLPQKTTTVAHTRTVWQRVRPYAYMAAMFAGIWCMLKMFMLMGGDPGQSLNIDENPGLARVAADEQFVEDYIIDDVSPLDLYNSMLDDSIEVYSIYDSLYNASADVAPLP